MFEYKKLKYNFIIYKNDDLFIFDGNLKYAIF